MCLFQILKPSDKRSPLLWRQLSIYLQKLQINDTPKVHWREDLETENYSTAHLGPWWL
ncbi:unnamed protein product, partial [Brassica rapa subsp. narinosa]